MRHQVVVLEDDLHRFAGFHGHLIPVEEHLIDDRAELEDANAQVSKLLPDQRSLVTRQEGCKRLAQLQGVHDGGDIPIADRDALHVSQQVFEQGAGLVLRPVSRRDSQDGLHGGMPVRAVPDKLLDGLECLILLAANRGQRRHGRAPNGPFRSAPLKFEAQGTVGSGRCLYASLLKQHPAIRAEDLQGEIVESVPQAPLVAVKDRDRVDRQFGAEVDLPPGVGTVFLRVCLSSHSVQARGVTVDRPGGYPFV